MTAGAVNWWCRDISCRIPGGVTLSELYSDHNLLLQSLLGALGSSSMICFDASVSALVELVSAVDILPGRREAVHAIIAGKKH